MSFPHSTFTSTSPLNGGFWFQAMQFSGDVCHNHPPHHLVVHTVYLFIYYDTVLPSYLVLSEDAYAMFYCPLFGLFYMCGGTQFHLPGD